MEPDYSDPAVQPLVHVRGGNVYVAAVELSESGELLVYGSYYSAILLGPDWFVPESGSDLFIARFSAAGQYLWSRRIEGDAVGSFGASLDPAGDLIVAGEIYGQTDLGDGPLGGPSGFIAKYDGDDGSLLWKVLLTGGRYHALSDVATDAQGNVFVGGQLSGAAMLGDTAVSGGADAAVLVAKLAPADGNPVWVRAFRAADGWANADRLAVDGDGAVIVGGRYGAAIDLGCGPLPSAAGGSYPDAFVARLGANGGCRWSRPLSGTGYVEIDDIAASGTSVVVGGDFGATVTIEGETQTSAGESDGFAVAFSSAGAHDWTHFFPGESYDYVRAVRVLPDGRTVIAGDHRGDLDLGGVEVCTKNNGYFNAFAAIYDPNGELSWQREYGLEIGCGCSGTSAYASAVAVAPDGTFRLAGQFADAVDLGAGLTETIYGSNLDAFVVSLDPR
jgi:hypothetical protein